MFTCQCEVVLFQNWMCANAVEANVGAAVKVHMDHEILWLQNSTFYECNHLCLENIKQ